jgi:hypothetical protein
VDELSDIIRLAGVNEFKGYTEYTLENMSQTATAIKQKERDENIKPGDKEWFELWFSKPYMTGHTFRGRTKK